MHIYSVYIETQAPLILVGIENVGKRNATMEDSCMYMFIVINDTHTKNRREHGFIELTYEIQCELRF